MNAMIVETQDAKAMLPEISEIVDELIEVRAEIDQVNSKVSLLETLWNADIRKHDNPDAGEYLRLSTRKRTLVRLFREKADELDGMGCHVKDLEEREIGFFTIRDDQVMFMAWNLSEPEEEMYEEIALNARVFTVSEANAIIPWIKEMLGELDTIRENLGEQQQELQLLQVMWSDGVDTEENPDAHRMQSITTDIQEKTLRGRELELTLLRRGCQIKDYHEGLVDFYHVRDGQVTLLCWKRGENDVEAWHTLDGGFAGRKSLKS
jgi:hypothetical protein